MASDIDVNDNRAQVELDALARQVNQDAISDPATLASCLDAQFVRRPHLDYISSHFAEILAGNIKRLMIMVPPQTGKSVLSAVWAPFWFLAHDPSARILIAAYNQALANQRGRSIQKLVITHGWRWGLALERGAKQKAEWKLAPIAADDGGVMKQGGIKSVGINAGVTGFPADIALVDDPHKNRVEAESKVYRDRVWDWFSADFTSRLGPDAPMIVIATPWHEDDLMHRCLKRDGRDTDGGQWRVIKLHALAQPGDPLGRAVDEPLWHPMIETDDVEARRRHWETKRLGSTLRDWSSLYMLDPRPRGGALVTEDLLAARSVAVPPADPVRYAVAIDPSGGGSDVAGIIAGFLGTDGRLYVTHDRSVVGPSETWARAACELAVEVNADLFVVERNYGGDMVMAPLRLAWDRMSREHAGSPAWRNRLMPRVETAWGKKGKYLRAEPVAQQISYEMMWFVGDLGRLKSEWQTWRPTDAYSPGRIDASVYLALELLTVPGSEALVSTPTGVDKRAAARPSRRTVPTNRGRGR